VSCVEDALLRAGKAEGDARARQLAASARDGLLLKKFAMPQLVSVLDGDVMPLAAAAGRRKKYSTDVCKQGT
jgi:hypothetical protein